MSTNKRWDDASEKDLIFAMLMSTGDGTGNIKADWQKVEKIMTSWGHSFTIGAMSQRWSKTIQKAFKERHPDNAKDGGNTDPATPSKAVAGSRTSKTPKTPKSAQGKSKKRLADEDISSEPIAKEKTPCASDKKMKFSEYPDEDEENVTVKRQAVDEDYDV